MRKILLLVLAYSCLGNAFGTGSQVDQSNIIRTDSGWASVTVDSVTELAQTFTAGSSGFLTQVDLQVYKWGNLSQITRDLVLTISRAPSLNTPLGTPLATVALHPGDIKSIDEWPSGLLTTIRLNSPPIVNQGERFSMMLTSAQPFGSSGNYDWVITQSVGIDRYTAGEAWYNNLNSPVWFKQAVPSDRGFRTYVAPIPEPTTVTLLGFGSLVLVLRRCRDESE